MNSNPNQIYLSPPHMGEKELQFVHEAFQSNWIAPVGPHIDAFEKEFSTVIGSHYALAVSSGTAAIHLALRLLNIGPGDEVLCSTLSFIASASPIIFLGAKPVFIDSDQKTWNMDPALLAEEIRERAGRNQLPKAVILVHLYGQSADIDPILEICNYFEIPLIEDAAESLGATYKGKSPGSFGIAGIFSFNGNKIITTSGGGMLVSGDKAFIEKARFLATQAKDPAPHYEHSVIGYNYPMSNVLAAIGRGQLRVLSERIEARRRNFKFYQNTLGVCDGLQFMSEAPYGRCTRWLTCLTVDEKKFDADKDTIIDALKQNNIEARPIWKPLHLQPVFKDCKCKGGAVSEKFFATGLCLPSGSNLTMADLEKISNTILATRKNSKYYFANHKWA